MLHSETKKTGEKLKIQGNYREFCLDRSVATLSCFYFLPVEMK